jgi:hypothetical protein
MENLSKNLHLVVVSIVRQGQLRPNEEDLFVVAEKPAIIPHILVLDGHPDIQQDILTVWMLDDLAQTLPTVHVGVTLEKVVPISRQSLYDSQNVVRKLYVLSIIDRT